MGKGVAKFIDVSTLPDAPNVGKHLYCKKCGEELTSVSHKHDLQKWHLKNWRQRYLWRPIYTWLYRYQRMSKAW